MRSTAEKKTHRKKRRQRALCSESTSPYSPRSWFDPLLLKWAGVHVFRGHFFFAKRSDSTAGPNTRRGGANSGNPTPNKPITPIINSYFKGPHQ